ncbi:YhcN/YlaJ family sporulation lipoprotein [Neobacillus dielmonensis]|uniref:YhcN/YlaJ family sporulation lipoprotein n=1 Tax=Neobacillus dielmonensis TaxID=1347369 RepID=UPI000693DA18|nr:YhcN/YlaJ family sporulation lipoprotein [Neobacillus dielmonensis]
MYWIRIIMALFVLVCLTSCAEKQQMKDSQLALIKATDPKPVVTDGKKGSEQAEDIKHDVSSFPEIYDVAVVKGKNGALVVYKVKHMQRFNMKKIESKVTKKLEGKYPKEKFTVSSDYKIFLEVVRLNEKMRAGTISNQNADKRFKEIVKMTEDMK